MTTNKYPENTFKRYDTVTKYKKKDHASKDDFYCCQCNKRKNVLTLFLQGAFCLDCINNYKGELIPLKRKNT